MKKAKHIIVAVSLLLVGLGFTANLQAQVFWIGVNGGATYSWFNSPKADNLVTSGGYGWNLGFFAKYGKRPFYKLGFHWTRANQDMKLNLGEGNVIEDMVPFHNFDLHLKVGYEIVYKSKFKCHVNAGPFIGRTFLFSTNVFEIEEDDMQNPQYGVVGGTGIQYLNFIVDLDYQYHISELFKGDEQDLGIDFGSHLQHISLKIGFQF